MKLKKLIEQRNDKLAQMNKLMETAEAEARALTDDEQAEFDKLAGEVKGMAKTIHANEQLEGMDGDAEARADAEADDRDVDAEEYRAFGDYIRGVTRYGEQEARAATNLTFGSNGAIVPTTIANKIIQQVKNICPIYRLATHYSVPGNLTVPYIDTADSDITVAYADEFVELTSSSHKYASISLSGFLYGTLTLVSKRLVNNAQFDVVPLVIDHMAENIAAWVEGELLNGTTDKISGLAAGVTQTVTAASATAITADELIDVQESVPDVYQRDAVWIMSPAARRAIRKLKDGEGRYLLNPDLTGKWSYILLGKPVFVSDNMADPAAGKTAVIYGDMSGLAVKESENLEIQVLVEHYATQHAVGIVAWGELDAKVENAQKLAALKMKTE